MVWKDEGVNEHETTGWGKYRRSGDEEEEAEEPLGEEEERERDGGKQMM